MFYKILSLSFLLFFSINLSAQMRTLLEDRHSIDPYFTYYRGTNTTKTINLSQEQESPFYQSGNLYDYVRLGVNYSYAIKDKFYVFSGIAFSNPQQKIFVITDRNKVLKTYTRRMVELPIGVRWIYSKKRCKSYLSLEYINQFYVNSIVKKRNESYIEQEDINKHQKSFNVGFGAEFRPWSMIGIYTQLNALVKMLDKEAGEKRNNLGMGVSIGTRFYL